TRCRTSRLTTPTGTGTATTAGRIATTGRAGTPAATTAGLVTTANVALEGRRTNPGGPSADAPLPETNGRRLRPHFKSPALDGGGGGEPIILAFEVADHRSWVAGLQLE